MRTAPHNTRHTPDAFDNALCVVEGAFFPAALHYNAIYNATIRLLSRREIRLAGATLGPRPHVHLA